MIYNWYVTILSCKFCKTICLNLFIRNVGLVCMQAIYGGAGQHSGEPGGHGPHGCRLTSCASRVGGSVYFNVKALNIFLVYML